MSLTTRLSLIDALKHGGAEAWERFYNMYSRVLLSFARRQGCDEHAALDVVQETLMVVLRKLPDFEYDADRGRFRNWLISIVSNKVCESRRRARLDRLVSLDAPLENGQSFADMLAADQPDVAGKIEQDWRQALLEEALRQVLEDPRTNADTVAIFRAVAMEGRTLSDVAKQFRMKENAIYQIKHRIMTRLQGVIARLENGDDDLDA
jgi:RNA polymerase sigma factor (sigma-70 family)